MHIEINDDASTLAGLRICHKDQVTVWDASAYDRPAKGNYHGIFREINAYWATLPENRQQGIYDTYAKIKETFETVFDTMRLHKRLVELSKELLDQHPQEEIRYWITVKSDLKIPSSMKEYCGPNDPRDRTYLRSDYAGLMELALNLRPMMPVWGEYIRRTKDEAGSNYKEYVAFGLLGRTHIMETAAIDRLREYIDAWVGPDTVTMSSVLAGLGSEQFPEWLLGLALVRKVVLVDIGQSDEKENIISNVYRIVKNTIDTLNRKSGGAITDKQPMDDANDDDNSSAVEAYKVKQLISDGDMVSLSVYTEDIHGMAKKVDPSIDLDKVDQCYTTLYPHGTMEIVQHQLTFAQWCLKPALSPRGIPSLNKPSLLRAMACSQAILWHWGFIDLALMATATPIVGGKDTMLNVVESRARIPKEAVQRLLELYPYYQNNGGKQATYKQLNPACKAIELIAKDITRFDWEVTAPQNLKNSNGSLVGNSRLIVPPDIKGQLARLVIYLAERDQQRKQEISSETSVV